MRRSFKTLISGLVGAVGLVGLVSAPASATSITDAVTVAIEPATVDLVLGESTDITVAVTNTGARSTPPLVVHLDITNPDKNVSVDPEDWTSELSQQIGVVAPGDTVTLDWNLQPISPGTFSAYTVALSSGVPDLAASNVVRVSVADRRSLNPGGILPVAIGAPAVVGGLLLVQMRFARRSRRGEVPDPVTS